jgi:uncharacterized damage-inducible protein DinB
MDLHDVRTLFAYNRWSNARVLDAAARLTDEQFRAPGRLAHGGLRGTLVHTLFAEWVWRMRWQGTPPHHAFRFGAVEFPSLPALRERWLEEEALLMEMVEGLTDDRLRAAIEYTSTEGGRHRRILWETMAHLVNHGTQHRSEVAAILTELGHSPGDIDLIVFLNEDG